MIGSMFRFKKIAHWAIPIALATTFSFFSTFAFAQIAKDLSALNALVLAHPKDVDMRLRLATMLSWEGKRDLARQHVLKVIALAPKYWDAHLLLAKLDAWDGRYNEADQRIQQVLQYLPDHKPANLILLDVAIWSKQYEKAKQILAKLLAQEQSAEIYYRLAEVENLQLHSWKAYQLSKIVLRLDPLHRRARQLRQDIQLASIDLSYEFESFPLNENNLGHGELLAISLLPRAQLSATLFHELRYRYGTINNRLLLQGDWRINSRMQLSLTGGGAMPASVVSQATGALRLTTQLATYYDTAFSYTYDRLPWAGNLHSLRFTGGALLPSQIHLEATYLLGLLGHYCSDGESIHGVELRASIERPRWQAQVSYGFGTELFQLLLKPETTAASTDNPCSTTSGTWALQDLRAHTFALGLLINITRRLALHAGYGIQLRFNGDEAHFVSVGSRMGF